MPNVEEFVGDDDYALRWPADLFGEELQRLVDRAGEPDPEWTDEVALLLSQAFVSAAPVEKFRRLASNPLMPSDDDVPF